MADILEQMLEDRGLTFDKLTTEERDMWLGWAEQLSSREITIDDVKAFIANLRLSLDEQLATSELSTHGIFSLIFFWRRQKDIYLKARLKNIILIENMLLSPDKAKKALESYIKSLPKNKAL